MTDSEGLPHETFVGASRTIIAQCPKCGQLLKSLPITEEAFADPKYIPVFPPHICPGTREPTWDKRGTR